MIEVVLNYFVKYHESGACQAQRTSKEHARLFHLLPRIPRSSCTSSGAQRPWTYRLTRIAVALPLLLLLTGCGILPGSSNSTSRATSTAASVSATPTAVPMLKIVTPTPGTPIPLATAAQAQGQGSPSASGSGATVSYVVKPGDTLDAIADEHNVSVKTLEEMNDITNPTDLQAGQVIKIPRTP